MLLLPIPFEGVVGNDLRRPEVRFRKHAEMGLH